MRRKSKMSYRGGAVVRLNRSNSQPIQHLILDRGGKLGNK
jgi:hypothetical protein